MVKLLNTIMKGLTLYHEKTHFLNYFVRSYVVTNPHFLW